MTGQTVSAFGDSFAAVAMPLLVLAVTGSVAQMGLVVAVSTVCQLGAGLFAGSVVERVDRRRLMISGDVLQMSLTAAVPLAWWLLSDAAWRQASMWIVYVVVAASSLVATNYRVALRTFLPQLVGRDSLTHANSQLTMTTEIAFGLGPAVAGLAVASFGAPVAIGINAASFAVSALALWLVLPRPELAPARPQPHAAPAGARAARFPGLKFIWRHDFLRALGILEVLNAFLVAGVVSLFIYFLRHDLNESPVVVGMLLSLASVGAVLATLIVTPLRARFGIGPTWLASVALQGVALAGVAFSTSVWLVAFLAMLFALGQVSAIILATTRRQELTPDRLLARVSAAVITALLAAQAIGTPALTWATSLTSSRTVFIAAGVLLLAVALAGTRTRVRADRSRANKALLPVRRRWPRPLRLGVALAVSGALLFVCAAGVGNAVPPLGRVLDPNNGVWRSAESTASLRARDEVLRLPGLEGAVRVSFNGDGVPTIHAGSARDAFLAQGYVTAQYRLFQMDLMRRQGGGRLAEVLGSGALASDRVELSLGLERTARALYRSLPAESEARSALDAYAAGVNVALARIRAANHLPAPMQLLDYEPREWTPVDSLLIQGVLTQMLSYTTTPLRMTLLERTLGRARTEEWFPVVARTEQAPYDRGPYRRDPLAPIPGRIPGTEPTPGTHEVPAVPAGETSEATAAPLQAGTGVASSALAWLSALPSQVARGGNSNNWAVAPARASGGEALLASDPHLEQTLPSIWFQVALDAPGLQVTGVAVPGLAGVLIGRTPDLAWGLTNTQNQSALFYRETLHPRNPDYYRWRGAWHRFRKVRYSIPVKGADPVEHVVRISVHGPLVLKHGRAAAVWWAGAVPSRNLDAVLALYRARTGAEVRRALAGWLSPTQNFAYATASGDVGIYAPGIYPQVRSGARPWFPLSGTGADDVLGTIPLRAVPQVSNPPEGFVLSANQRPVTAAYPYYLGTTANGFDPGYRAVTIERFLAARPEATLEEMKELQADETDGLAARLVPHLLAALRTQADRLGPREREAVRLLSGWDYSMSVDSPAASVWWTFLDEYLRATFEPWWRAKRVPVETASTLRIGANLVSLCQNLEHWSAHDRANPAFDLPDGTQRTAPEVMRVAFHRAITDLAERLGGAPATWAWGRLHTRRITSLAGVAAFDYGPRPSGGDTFTPNAAGGGLVSRAGPTWRMVVSFAGGSFGVYPGGQSENPLSPWYDNLVESWGRNRYRPLQPDGRDSGGRATWTLEPAR